MPTAVRLDAGVGVWKLDLEFDDGERWGCSGVDASFPMVAVLVFLPLYKSLAQSFSTPS